MKKRMIGFALTLAMLLSMTTVAFATESKDWESEIDVVRVAVVGDDYYATLEDAFAAANGAAVSLSGDLTVKDVVIPAGAVLDLNGYTLTAESFDSIAAGAKIIDTTGGDGALVVSGECKFNESNPQLPIQDAEGAYHFFAVTVKSVAVTGNAKYWFQVKFENFEAVEALIAAGSRLDIKVDLTVDGEEAVAVADSEFLLKWAEAYKNNNGIYITAQIVDAEGKTISACPGVGANGVDILGKAL